MPFTPTHILAIVPLAALRRPRLPFSALAIGSMIPDLPMFLPWPRGYELTHSPAGVVVACLPLGLAGYLLFQSQMRRPLFAALPEAIQRRCASLARRRFEPTARSLGLAALAVVLGATTHILWDAFTHPDRWGTRLFPRLAEPLLGVGPYTLPGYKALQYGSTAIGLPLLVGLLVVWLLRQPRETIGSLPVLSRSRKRGVGLIVLAIPVLSTALVWAGGRGSAYEKLGDVITTSGLSLTTASIAFSLGFQLGQRQRERGR